MNVVHVKLSKNKRDWYVLANSRVLARPETKQDAIDFAVEYARSHGYQIAIHGLEGQIYGGGPRFPTARDDEFRDIVRQVLKLGKYKDDSSKKSRSKSHVRSSKHGLLSFRGTQKYS